MTDVSRRFSRMAAHIADRLGRRGTVLVLIGIIWVGYGISICLIDHPDRFSSTGPDGPLQFMDAREWCVPWLACGLFALGYGLRGRKLASDTGAFMALLGPPFLWTIMFLWSFAVAVATGGHHGRSTSWLGALVWAVAVVFILVIAGWADPGDISPFETREDRS